MFALLNILWVGDKAMTHLAYAYAFNIIFILLIWYLINNTRKNTLSCGFVI